MPLLMETSERMGACTSAYLPEGTCLRCCTGFEATPPASTAGTLREVDAALVRGNEIMYHESLCGYATVVGTAAMAGAVIPKACFKD
jgi:hypothetical protein